MTATHIRNILNILSEQESHDPRDFDPTDWLDDKQINRLLASGFNVDLVLFHGSDTEFKEFSLSKSRSAEHIYTSPDYETAGAYGEHLYACFGKTNPLADLIDNYETISKVAKEYSYTVERDMQYIYTDEYDALIDEIAEEMMLADPELDEDDAKSEAEDDPRVEEWVERKAVEYTSEQIETGELYQTDSRMQDAIMNACYGLGFNCVRFRDSAPTASGGEDESYVLGDSSNLFIIKQLR